MKKEKVVRTFIIILSCLLIINLALLLGLWIYNKLSDRYSETVVIEDNIITPDKETLDENAGEIPEKDSTGNRHRGAQSIEPEVSISLYRNHAEDVLPFRVDNMFPGDYVEKEYTVDVTYEGAVTVHFDTYIRNGYEILAKELKCNILLENSAQVLYDGPIQDMQKSVSWKLKSDTVTTERLHYKITAYLDTSTGNECQDQMLLADFRWWVGEDEEENLKPVGTGDASRLFVWMGVLFLMTFILLLLFWKKFRKEEYRHGE